jgi:hypothetical protein
LELKKILASAGDEPSQVLCEFFQVNSLIQLRIFLYNLKNVEKLNTFCTNQNCRTYVLSLKKISFCSIIYISPMLRSYAKKSSLFYTMPICGSYVERITFEYVVTLKSNMEQILSNRRHQEQICEVIVVWCFAIPFLF